MSDKIEEVNEEKANSVKNEPIPFDPLNINSIALMGDVDEDMANEIVCSLLLLKEKNKIEYLNTIINLPEDVLKDTDTDELRPNISLFVSTNGGSADEMLAIYDVMRMIKEEGINMISTHGVGKVMSAGVLLLAAGDKGKRFVGKHCRIMIHSVIGGHAGPMHQLENEFEEIKKIQDNYIKALSEETEMTEKYLRNLLKKKTNIYLTAQEAVDLGIADEII